MWTSLILLHDKNKRQAFIKYIWRKTKLGLQVGVASLRVRKQMSYRASLSRTIHSSAFSTSWCTERVALYGSTTVSDTLGDGKTENVNIIRSGYSSLILEIRRVPMPEPVPPPNEWQTWNPVQFKLWDSEPIYGKGGNATSIPFSVWIKMLPNPLKVNTNYQNWSPSLKAVNQIQLSLIHKKQNINKTNRTSRQEITK